MKILVTGSSGRVGRALVEELGRRGYGVTGFDLRPPEGRSALVSFLSGSLEDPDVVAEAVRDVQAVVHLGALMSWADSDARKLFGINVGGTCNLMEDLDRGTIRRFVFISSGEVYPEGNPEYQPIDERHPTKPLSMYGESKLLAEELVRFHQRRFNLPAVVLRISHTQDASELLDPDSFFSGPRFFLGPRIARARKLGKKAELALMEPLEAGGEKLILSRGSDGTPYMMHIAETRDIVQGIVLALESDRAPGEVFNIGPDEPVRFDWIIPAMHELTGLPVVEVNLPGPAISYRTSNTKARQLLGFRPQWDFDRMLREAAEAREKRAAARTRGGRLK